MLVLAKPGSQTAAVDHIRTEARSVKGIGDTGGTGPGLRVVGMDVMAGAVGEFRGVDEVLHHCPHLLPPGRVGVSPEILDLIFRRQLDALVEGVLVVEPGKHSTPDQTDRHRVGPARSYSKRRPRLRGRAALSE